MERNGNAFIDRAFKLGEIRNCRLENLVAEGLAYLIHVGLLKRAAAFVLGNDVAQQF